MINQEKGGAEILKYEELNQYTALLMINRPKALNSLNIQLLKELEKKLNEINNNNIRTVIITGAGERAFVGGADIKEMLSMNEEEALEFSQYGNSVFSLIETMDKVFIAAVDGYALGGGNELLTACDLRIATPKSKFGQPEVKLGIIPGFGATQRLPEIIGSAKAKELILTAKIISSEEALKIGLVNKIVSEENLLKEAKELASTISENAPLALKAAKKALLYQRRYRENKGFEFEAELFSKCFSTADQKRGMEAFINNKKAEFKAN